MEATARPLHHPHTIKVAPELHIVCPGLLQHVQQLRNILRLSLRHETTQNNSIKYIPRPSPRFPHRIRATLPLAPVTENLVKDGQSAPTYVARFTTTMLLCSASLTRAYANGAQRLPRSIAWIQHRTRSSTLLHGSRTRVSDANRQSNRYIHASFLHRPCIPKP